MEKLRQRAYAVLAPQELLDMAEAAHPNIDQGVEDPHKRNAGLEISRRATALSLIPSACSTARGYATARARTSGRWTRRLRTSKQKSRRSGPLGLAS